MLSCTATQKGGTLTIQGGADADQVDLHDDGQKNVEVICGDQDQTFHGVTQIIVNTAGGDDAVKYFLEPNSENALIGLLLPAVLKVDLGKGNDQFDLVGLPLSNPDRVASDGVSKWQLSVNGGEGDDRVSLSVDTSLWKQSTSADSFFDVFADLGAGHDDFVMQVLDTSLATDSGAPAESFSLNFAKIKLVGGTGDDVVDLVLQKVRKADVNVTGGAGDDQVTIKYHKHVTDSSLNVFADLGAGNDHAQITSDQTTSESVSLNFAKIIVNGGDGNDVMDVALQKVGRGTLQLSGGTGDDIVLMEHKDWLADSFFDVSVDLGTGDDQLLGTLGTSSDTAAPAENISLNFQKVKVEYKVDGGDGNDTLDLTLLNLNTAKIKFMGGRGDDIVNLKIHKVADTAENKNSFFDVFTDLGIGDDQFTTDIGGEGPEESTATENVTLNFAKINVLGGDGNDAILIGLLHTNKASIGVDSGRGDDIVGLKYIKGDSDSVDSAINLGAGNDVASFSWGAVGAGDVNGDNFSLNFLKVKIDAGDGNDALDLSMLKIHKADLDIIGGRGDDSVGIEYHKIANSVDSFFDVFTDLGLGDDQLHASVGSAGDAETPSESLTLNFAKIKVDIGGGSDVVDVTLSNAKKSSLLLSCASGKHIPDAIIVTRVVDVPSSSTFDSTIDLPGPGNDDIQVSLGGEADGSVTSDTVALDFAKVKINAGDGNDVINLAMKKVREAALDLHGGGGNDIVGIKGESVPTDSFFDVFTDLGIGNDEFHAALGGDTNGSVSSDTVALNFAKVKVMAGDGDDVVDLSLLKVRESAFDLQGGKGNNAFEIKDFSFGVENPTTIGSATGGAGKDQVRMTVGSGQELNGSAELPLNFAKLKIDLGDGDDQVDLALQNIVESHVNILGGRGNDIVNVKHNDFAADSFFDVFADLGAGDDQWMMTTGDTGEPSSNTVALNYLKVELHAGDGNDIVNMPLRTFADGQLQVFGDGGNDDLSIAANPIPIPYPTTGDNLSTQTALPVRQWIVDGGRGDDRIGLTFNGHLATDLHVMILGGIGNDHIESVFQIDSNSAANLSVEVFGGDNDDDLALSVFGGESLESLFALLDGGAGMDTHQATANVQVRNCEDVPILVLVKQL